MDCSARCLSRHAEQIFFEEQKGQILTVLMIRLARVGAPKKPYYRVVVIDKERSSSGRNVEVVGLYNPRTSPATIDLKRERIEHWVSKGAQLSDRVSRLLAKSAPAAGTPVNDSAA